MHGRKVSWTISYHLNNEQNIVPNNAQNNGQNNPQNIVHNNAQFEIQNHPPNAQNFVTRDEFDEFKESINGRFDRLERSIQALGRRNLNNEERKRKRKRRKR